MGILQPGVHKVMVADVRWQPARDDFPPQLSIYFRDEKGDGIAWYLKLGSTKDGFNLKQFDYECDNLDKLGWKAEENGYRFEDLQDPATCPFAHAETTIRVDAYNGKPQFKWIEGGGTFSGERMAPAAAKSYMDQVRARLASNGRAVKPSAPKPAPAAPAERKPPTNQPYESVSDIPFSFLAAMLSIVGGALFA